MDLYSENILYHYKEPHNKGALENASVAVQDSNPLCGDELKIYLKIDDTGKIADVGFTGKGCAISQASMSMLTDELLGKNIGEAEKIDNQKIFQMVGVPLTASRVKCALLGLVAMKKALIIYKNAQEKN